MYKVVGLDNYGRSYYSNMVIMQPMDTIPPDRPTGLIAQRGDGGEIQLDWDDNSEADLMGYRVYRSNTLNGAYVNIHSKAYPFSSYKDVLDLDVTTDSVFYKVLATDHRGNWSPLSKAVGLDRPDNVPPASSTLSNIRPGKGKVFLTWSLSESKDVANYTLRRKQRGYREWVDVVEFVPASSIAEKSYGTGFDTYNYIDSINLQPRTYTYRLETTDNEGNTSVSNELSTQPLPVTSTGLSILKSLTYTCNQDSVAKIQDLYESYQAIQATVGIYNNNAQALSSALVNLVATNTISISQYQQMYNLISSLGSNYAGPLNNFINGQLASLQKELSQTQCMALLRWDGPPPSNTGGPITANQVGLHGVVIYRAVDFGEFELLDRVYQPALIHDGDSYVYFDLSVRQLHHYSYKIRIIPTTRQVNKLSRPLSIFIKPE